MQFTASVSILHLWRRSFCNAIFSNTLVSGHKPCPETHLQTPDPGGKFARGGRRGLRSCALCPSAEMFTQEVPGEPHMAPEEYSVVDGGCLWTAGSGPLGVGLVNTDVLA